MCDDTEAKTRSHRAIHGSVSVTQNESGVRVHPDKNHVMLTGPPPILPPKPLSPETLEGAGCIYNLTFDAVSLQPPSRYSVGNKVCAHCSTSGSKVLDGYFQHESRVV